MSRRHAAEKRDVLPDAKYGSVWHFDVSDGLLRQGERTAAATYAGIDDGEMDAGRHERKRVRQHERPLEHMTRPDPVRDVDHASVGSDRCDHAVARADEVVLQPEVGQEGDDHGVERNASTRPSRS